jgi:hypothetical protein
LSNFLPPKIDNLFNLCYSQLNSIAYFYGREALNHMLNLVARAFFVQFNSPNGNEALDWLS